MAIRTQSEPMIRRVQFIRRTKEATRQHLLEMPEDIIQNMGSHVSIIGKMMRRFICFVHITTATTPLPN